MKYLYLVVLHTANVPDSKYGCVYHVIAETNIEAVLLLMKHDENIKGVHEAVAKAKRYALQGDSIESGVVSWFLT